MRHVSNTLAGALDRDVIQSEENSDIDLLYNLTAFLAFSLIDPRALFRHFKGFLSVSDIVLNMEEKEIRIRNDYLGN